LLTETFAAAMARLGPYGTPPRLAAGVSGGADSTALALLAQDWVAAQGGSLLALIVDHGLRPDSAQEAVLTAARLAARGIAAKILTLSGLGGPALQERARMARHQALAEAAYEAGCLHLLLGHHAADQAETVAMRAARGSSGLEGMAARAFRDRVVLLRPLLHTQPAELRAYLAAQGISWVEDPSNQNQKFERVRVRESGVAPGLADATLRLTLDAEVRKFLAQNVSIRPEGFAIIRADATPDAALAVLLRTIGGAAYKPDQKAVRKIATKLRPATLGGVQIAPAGRLGPGWLLVREPAACEAPIPALQNALWDGRFRLTAPHAGSHFGALGKSNETNDLPALIQAAMPAIIAPDGAKTPCREAIFAPPMPAAGAKFLG
jgi:tRNA(Ile)-lysidine synthase